jgi:hypothetical protein
MARWREQLFTVMSRNTTRAARFFNLPSDRTVEVGIQVDLYPREARGPPWGASVEPSSEVRRRDALDRPPPKEALCPLPPPPTIAPASGKLGVLTVGLGAVATTLISGVELVKRGMAAPIGSLSQMGTIRLGKRTDQRVPLIRDFVPLASLDDVVFGAWDPFPDDAYVAASRAGVLESRHLEAIAESLRSVQPMKAAFDPFYVKRLDGPNVIGVGSKRKMLEGIREGIHKFANDNASIAW